MYRELSPEKLSKKDYSYRGFSFKVVESKSHHYYHSVKDFFSQYGRKQMDQVAAGFHAVISKDSLALFNPAELKVNAH